ncbi:MAG TPA: sulfate adenylyltransferase subunit CysN [Acidisarcina sp.]
MALIELLTNLLEEPLPAADAALDSTEGLADFSIAEFLRTEQAKDLLRFSTAGSVDDGKSTLIGRLLYDSQNVYEDHVRAVTRTQGEGRVASIDFALLTDGLRAEREQGITIDVAYRYFSTARRKFIIADTPGHEQYTRNMATGASTADLAIILVDARKGILVQSRRHAFIASLLGIRHVVAAINKMDLVDYSESVFEGHKRDLLALADRLGIADLVCIPVSALEGDNVVKRSAAMPWYAGPSLLEHLESVPLHEQNQDAPFRMAVQRVIRPHQNFRGFAGQIASGAIHPGDTIVALPSGRTSRVQSISTFDGELDVATAPLSITLTLEDELDISRGDLISAADTPPISATRVEASVVWLNSEPLDTAKTLLLKHTTQTVKARVAAVQHKVNIHTLDEEPATTLAMNEIGVLEVESITPLFVDAYNQNRVTGSFILIDPMSNATVGAGMIRRVLAAGSAADFDSDLSSQWTHGAAIILVDAETGVPAALESALLFHGCAVGRTRVRRPEVWRAMFQAGLITIVEREGAGPMEILTSTSPAGLVGAPFSVADDQPAPEGGDESDLAMRAETIAKQITDELRARGVLAKRAKTAANLDGEGI